MTPRDAQDRNANRISTFDATLPNAEVLAQMSDRVMQHEREVEEQTRYRCVTESWSPAFDVKSGDPASPGLTSVTTVEAQAAVQSVTCTDMRTGKSGTNYHFSAGAEVHETQQFNSAELGHQVLLEKSGKIGGQSTSRTLSSQPGPTRDCRAHLRPSARCACLSRKTAPRRLSSLAKASKKKFGFERHADGEKQSTEVNLPDLLGLGSLSAKSESDGKTTTVEVGSETTGTVTVKSGELSGVSYERDGVSVGYESKHTDTHAAGSPQADLVRELSHHGVFDQTSPNPGNPASSLAPSDGLGATLRQTLPWRSPCQDCSMSRCSISSTVPRMRATRQTHEGLIRLARWLTTPFLRVSKTRPLGVRPTPIQVLVSGIPVWTCTRLKLGRTRADSNPPLQGGMPI